MAFCETTPKTPMKLSELVSLPRRRLLTGILPAALLAGCASSLRAPLLQNKATQKLAPVQVSADRIIRRVVGLRPYRAHGFNVRVEKLGAKTLVHHYGHGGAGITLSWGTAALALQQLNATPSHCAVLGCGAVGLATARLLQERGAQVIIYAKDIPPNTTSNVAIAQWWPSYLYDQAQLTPVFRAQLVFAAHFAYTRFQGMVGQQYGISWITGYGLSDTLPEANPPESAEAILANLQLQTRYLRSDEHPFPVPYVRAWEHMIIDTAQYLAVLLKDFLRFGGKLVVKPLRSALEVAQLPEPIIFNCTGMGAGTLFNDPMLTPIKGQLTVLLPQPEVKYGLNYNRTHMYSRPDGILLGGTAVYGDDSLTFDCVAETRIMATQRELFLKGHFH